MESIGMALPPLTSVSEHHVAHKHNCLHAGSQQPLLPTFIMSKEVSDADPATRNKKEEPVAVIIIAFIFVILLLLLMLLLLGAHASVLPL